ncbi:MAG: ABC transporter permease [Ruminococcus sp.]|nr:ABC transporter permease [Ruminococcus sp.]
MKFLNLLKKELREVITPQTIAILVLILFGMTMLGNVMTSEIEEANEESSKIVICDQDGTEFTNDLIELLRNPGGVENDVTVVELESDDYAAELKRLDQKNVLILPKGFTDQVTKEGKTADIIYVCRLSSLSTMSNISTGSETAKLLIEANIKTLLYNQKTAKGQLSKEEVEQLNTPISIEEKTVVSDNSADISSQLVLSMKMMENMFLPIIVFVLIVYSSQMLLGAVSTEKIDKTLETLLSAPVSRMSVLTSKMLAAGLVAALYAIVMTIGMNRMTGAISQDALDDFRPMIEDLGLTLSFGQYVLVGLQMFVSILISLSLSLVFGVLAKDAKSGQSLLLPIQITSMVPYMLSMFMDIRSLSPVVRYVIYAIPFTHTFMATENLMFGNISLYVGGLIYQLVLLVICMTFAIKVFTSDKIFTMTLGGKSSGGFSFGKKKASPPEE